MDEKVRLFRSGEAATEYRTAYESALARWPISVERLYLPTSLGTTHVVATGNIKNPPVLLLHPAGCGSAIWGRNVGPLSDKYPVYAVDTMGEVNLSTPSSRVRSIWAFLSWIEELLNLLESKRRTS